MEMRYMVFAWDYNESYGGMSDYCFSFNDLEDFKKSEHKTDWLDIIQIYDTKNDYYFQTEGFEEMCKDLELYIK